METGMSDGSVPGPSWTQNLDDCTIQGLTGNMNAILGFHPTSTEKIVATKWRYDMIVI